MPANVPGFNENRLPLSALAAALVYSTKQVSRPGVRVVHIECGIEGNAIIVATDGHAMIILRTAIRWTLGEVNLPRDFVESLCKGRRALELVDFSWASLDMIEAKHVGGPYINKCFINPKAPPFPFWRTVVPDTGTLDEIGCSVTALGASKLDQIAKAAKALKEFLKTNRNRDQVITLMPMGRDKTVGELMLVADQMVTQALVVLMPVDGQPLNPDCNSAKKD